MEAALRLLTKEAMKDHNFGQTFFDQGNPSEEEVLQKADMSRANKMAFKMFTHSSEIQIRKQYKVSNLSLLSGLFFYCNKSKNIILPQSMFNVCEPNSSQVTRSRKSLL